MFSKLPTHESNHPLFAELREFYFQWLEVIPQLPRLNTLQNYTGPFRYLFYKSIQYDLYIKTAGDPSLVTAEMIFASAEDPGNHPTHGFTDLRDPLTGVPYADTGDEEYHKRHASVYNYDGFGVERRPHKQLALRQEMFPDAYPHLSQTPRKNKDRDSR